MEFKANLMNACSSAVRSTLAKASPSVLSVYCIVAAFSTYFCMYAFRKPFTAATFDDLTYWGVHYKTILVTSQVAGYTLSKFIGIKVISEMPTHRRAIGIVSLIGTAHVALLMFAIIPPPLNLVCLFINGLPLGMVFGLVLAFLEGRKQTEALAAGLCASFIVSSGVVKSIGRYLVTDYGVTQYWMPFVTGLFFLGPLLFFVWMLNQIPPPSKEDEIHRSLRKTMNHRQRKRFFNKFAFGLSCLMVTYVLLTIMRSVRDDFAVEIWRDLGEKERPSIFAWSEILVMLGVVVINGSTILIQSNRFAFVTSLASVVFGFLLVLVAATGQVQGWLPPFSFMVLIGLGMYVPYVAYHTTLFERLIAAFREQGTIGYLMYLADATGYLGYVAVMLFRNFASTGTINVADLLVQMSICIALVSIVITAIVAVHFFRRMPQAPAELSNV